MKNSERQSMHPVRKKLNTALATLLFLGFIAMSLVNIYLCATLGISTLWIAQTIAMLVSAAVCFKFIRANFNQKHRREDP